MCNFKTRLEAHGYPKNLIESTLSEVSFAGRQSALKKQTKQTKGQIKPFVTTYHLGVKSLKQILMQKWSLIQNQPLLKTIYTTPPIISYKKGKSHKDVLVRAKLWRLCAVTAKPHRGVCVGLSMTLTIPGGGFVCLRSRLTACKRSIFGSKMGKTGQCVPNRCKDLFKRKIYFGVMGTLNLRKSVVFWVNLAGISPPF